MRTLINTGLRTIILSLVMFTIAHGQQPEGGRNQDFDEAVGKLLPVPPEEIDSFQEQLEDVRTAVHDRRELEVVSATDLVSLDPGDDPPEIALSPGIATVIVFADATGQPWPVDGYVVGDGEGYDVTQLGTAEGKPASHITVAPRKVAGWTNLVVHLQGEERPVILTLEINSEKVHYRHDIQVLGQGPLARPTLGHQLIEPPRAGNRSMLAFISAVDIPPTVRKLEVTGVPDTDIWSDGETMWVRTRWVLLSPQFKEVMVLGDIRVYRLPRIATLLFFVNEQTRAARVDLS